MTDEERKQVEKILDKCICIQESGFVYPDCAFCNHAEAVLAIIKERDAWRAKYRSCAWCKGNVELADHSDDCPVRQCQRLEVERDELRGVVEAVRLERGEREQLDCIGIDGSYADRWKAAERHVKAQQRVYAALDKLDGKEAP